MLTKNINFKNFFKNKKRNNIVQILENLKKNFFLEKINYYQVYPKVINIVLIKNLYKNLKNFLVLE